MKTKIYSAALLFILVFLPITAFCQTLNFGVLDSFEGYTGAGDISHSGSLWTGDVGTHAGAITGTYTGQSYTADGVTDQSRLDLMKLYIHLYDLYVDYPGTHKAIFGDGETITPGVYSIPAAGSVSGALTLDGGGDPNAFFVIKFYGAMTVDTGAEVTLTGGAQSCNVFWITEGSISLASSTNIKGTLLAHIGAIELGAGAHLEGRILTMAGAISTAAGAEVSRPNCVSTIQISCGTDVHPALEVDVLGSISNFSIFTSHGAVPDLALSGIFGDIGTNEGAISGSSNQIHVGNKYSADAITAEAKTDLDLAYPALVALPNTVTAHPATFGLGETLNAGIYHIASAGSLAGTITLDGRGDPNAIFIFKFAGAFSVDAASKVILTNRTQFCNVFWIAGAGVVTGAIHIGSGAVMKGTFIAHNGACGAGDRAFIEGRMLSTGGEITTNTSILYPGPTCITSSLGAVLPIELLSFTAEAKDAHIELNWSTASEINNDYFNIERSADGTVFTSISTISGAGNSNQTLSYLSVDNAPLLGTSYYRLKQTDYDGKTSFSSIQPVEFNVSSDYIFDIYPNPFSVQTIFHANENMKGATLIVYNAHGLAVKKIENITGRTFTLTRENLTNGLYFVCLVQDNKIVATEKLAITN